MLTTNWTSCLCFRYFEICKTRSQAVARITDRSTSLSQQIRYTVAYVAIVAKIASPAVFEILWSKRIGVTSLTFRDHVMSSLHDHSFDTPCAISYWWSFGTKHLSLTVSEIFNVKCNAIVGMALIL